MDGYSYEQDDTDRSPVCGNDGTPVAETGDLCESCIESARAGDLYFRLHHGMGDRDAIVAELRAMGEWEDDPDELAEDAVEVPAPSAAEIYARATGAASVTYIVERRNADGTLETISSETFTR
jgi:hypothetical protein